MSFSKQILGIFVFIALLLTLFAVFTLVTFEQIGAENDQFIDDQAYVFSQILIAVKEAKSLEAAGAHFLIVGTPETYDVFQEAHKKLRATAQSLINNPRFKKYKSELEQVAFHEIEAERAGAVAFRGRLSKKLSFDQTAAITSRDGLPHVMAIQKILARVQDESLQNWQKASSEMRSLHRKSKKILSYALIGFLLLMTLLVAALWKILQQKNQIDIKRHQLLESEQVISNARKEAVETVAHDLRSPLSSIKMCLDILSETAEGEQTSLLRIGQNAVCNGLRLIEKILDHTKIESGAISVEKTDCDLKELLNEQALRFKALCRDKGVDFVVNISSEVDRCVCDADRVCQVLSNLVGNALKFSEKGQKIFMTALIKGSYVEIEIKDQGPGISKSDIEDIFERYKKSASAKYGGTGLGLAISKSIIQAHDGKIWVESQPGAGSSFYFTLPL